MKKTQWAISLFFFMAFCLQQVNATIWRVNNLSNYNLASLIYGSNFGGTSSFPVFKQINDAVGWTSVHNGDTLQVEGSTVQYADAIITKSLIIIGPGFILNQNTNTSYNNLTAQINQVQFNYGSSGSQLIGFVQIYGSAFGITLHTNNITIKRCWMPTYIKLDDDTLVDVTIVQNFFPYAVGNSANALYLAGGIYPANLVFNNNICQKTLVWAGPVYQCDNNVFDGPASTLNLQFTTGEFKNNILKSVNATVNITPLDKISYNTGNVSAQFGTSNNNLVVNDMSTLFVDPTTNTTDGDYQLKAGSIAGSDGTDRGVFGGAAITNRYTLSGLAPIPVVYTISTAGVAGTSGLPVTIKARTIN